MDYTKPFKYISEIVKYQSISGAADNLNIQQPALSKYLKKIEEELGVELFDRSTTPISITKAGECYLEAAKKIIDIDHQLHKQLHELKNANADIKVGISPSRAPYLMPKIIKEFRRRCPNVKVTVVEGTIQEISSALSRGELDIILSLCDDETKKFNYVELFNEHLLLAVPDQLNVLDVESAFADLNLIISSNGKIPEFFKDTRHEPRIIDECQNLITALSYVKEGLGIAIVPSYLADYGTSEGIRFFSLSEKIAEKYNRQIGLFYRKDQFLGEGEKKFICCAQNVVHK